MTNPTDAGEEGQSLKGTPTVTQTGDCILGRNAGGG